MTLEEYKCKLNDIVEHPETAATAILDVVGELEKDFGAHDAVAAELETTKTKLNEANEQSKALFRRMTGQAAPEGNESPEKDLIDELLGRSLRTPVKEDDNGN